MQTITIRPMYKKIPQGSSKLTLRDENQVIQIIPLITCDDDSLAARRR